MGENNSYLLHCTTSLLANIYHLSENEYIRKSIERRASYEYTNEIIELSYNEIGNIIRKTDNNIKTVKWERFEQASSLKIIDNELKELLIDLTRLRNKTVHTNMKINKNLLVFHRLINYITIGYAVFNISTYIDFLSFSNFRSHKKQNNVLYIDKKYIEEELIKNIIDKDIVYKSINKLAKDKSFRNIKIDFNQYTNLFS
ncbi:hypothetical protein [Clostridium sp. UBA1652]|uniref:hypothetical protein n=1 Tax=Clostridium sp. UBA1652 TaxID=1946348 RepID=UPI00257FED1C|nr:hypothetical protein [Clostridium sp. UBA1652]